jgi:F0F1-type ATP synthase membrane subunit c/vacuolar-type H+-ATPase subunit K
MFLLLYLLLAYPVLGQVTSSGIAITAPIDDAEVKDGDIICTYSQSNKRCNAKYDTAVFGVISEKPVASLEDGEVANGKLVVTSGITLVRVSGINGSIAEGDFITTSEIPGVGMKATRNGYVLGKAMEAFESSNSEDIGSIRVLVNIHPEGKLTGARGNLLEFIREGISVSVFSPVESLRYLLATLIVIISFTLGMIYFGRASRTGIEAIGRNPLAKATIQFTVIMNVVLTIVIVLVGLGIAYLILVL